MTNLYLQMLSFFYMIMVLILFFAKKRVNSGETKIFTILSLINLLGICLDLVIVYLSYVVPGNEALYILNKFYLLYILLWTAIFYVYIIYITVKSEYKKPLYRLTTILVSVAAVLVFYLPIYLYNLNNVMYTYGLSVTITYMTELFFVIMIICTVSVNVKNLFTKKYVPLISLVILCAVALIVRLLNPGLLLTTTLMTFINVLMYHTMENPDLKMIEQLAIAKTVAEKANRAKSDFLSSMSHEIRTPLNAVMGFSECIQNATTLEEAKENATDVISAGNTLLEIVNGILDVSKIEAGKLELIESNYNVIQLFKEVQRLIEGRINGKPLDFQVHIAEDIPPVLYGDHSNIKKIMINLLTNAVKYTDSGYVRLSVHCVQKENVCRLFISVKDSGRGIKPEQVNKLFTRFQRLEEDKNTTIEGTGLGLAITKQLVEMMNGNITVKSTYGKGSEFIAAIDQRTSLVKEEKIEQPIEGDLDLSGKKILVVDDNEMNLKVAKRLLSKYKATVECITSGIECLEKIKNKENFDLILMDDMMPKMSGVETLAKLKEIEDYHIPTIALTANAIHGMREKYLQDGFTDYLSKPIDKHKLFQILSNYITFDTTFKLEQEVKQETKVSETIQNSVVDKDQFQYMDCSNYTILIVDDNQMNIKIASKFLKPYQFTIEEALSGFECIEKIQNGKKYDLIFMDIMMPEMDGVETFHKLQKIPEFDTKVVVLTADAIEGAREKYLSEGFHEYIAKPINKEYLDKIIHKVFDQEHLSQFIPNELFDMSKPLNQIKIHSNLEYNPENSNSSLDSKDYLKQNGIDIDQAIELLGDIKTYHEMLKEFVANIEPRIQKLDQLQQQGDMQNYAIEVHSLKSDSKYLGFFKLADMAFNHELKSKNNQISFVQENYKSLITELNRVLDIAKEYIKKEL